MHTITWDEFTENLGEHENRYDLILSYSSIEHSGLGRYGDRLTPLGDLFTFQLMAQCMKPTGLCTAAVPTGQDLTHFNAHRIYGEQRIRAMEQVSGLRYVAFTNTATVLSYLLTGLVVLPRIDNVLVGADHLLGLHWLTAYQWLHARPTLAPVARLIYLSLSAELIVLILLLDGLALKHRARGLFRSFVALACLTIVIGVLLPATGAYVHYHLPIAADTGYVAQMQALRDGSLRTIDLTQAEGLVVFPSFHASLALLLAWSAAPLRRLRWAFWTWSGFILLVTPAEGGHYFIDVLAGMLLTALVVMAMYRRVPAQEDPAFPAKASADDPCDPPMVRPSRASEFE